MDQGLGRSPKPRQLFKMFFGEYSDVNCKQVHDNIKRLRPFLEPLDGPNAEVMVFIGEEHLVRAFVLVKVDGRHEYHDCYVDITHPDVPQDLADGVSAAATYPPDMFTMSDGTDFRTWAYAYVLGSVLESWTVYPRRACTHMFLSTAWLDSIGMSPRAWPQDPANRLDCIWEGHDIDELWFAAAVLVHEMLHTCFLNRDGGTPLVDGLIDPIKGRVKGNYIYGSKLCMEAAKVDPPDEALVKSDSHVWYMLVLYAWMKRRDFTKGKARNMSKTEIKPGDNTLPADRRGKKRKREESD